MLQSFLIGKNSAVNFRDKASDPKWEQFLFCVLNITRNGRLLMFVFSA